MSQGLKGGGIEKLILEVVRMVAGYLNAPIRMGFDKNESKDAH